jgi:tetratricopeptide (TPR) repeat protein
MKSLESYEPERNEACPCGSGQKFKKCCMSTYRSGHSNKARQKYKEGLYTEALRECRSHLCWYILCHRAHTIPFLQSKTKEAFDLLKVDIEALGAIVDFLHHCYARVGIIEEFPATLDRLRSVVDDPRWSDKIAYHRTLWWLVHKGDQEHARKSISGVDIANCNDADVLGVYLQVTAESMSVAEKLSFIDRIWIATENEGERLHYSVQKGVAHCLICEIANGCDIIEGAIRRYVDADPGKKSLYGEHQLAHAYYVLGAFKHDDQIINKAVEQIGKLLRDAEQRPQTQEGLAGLHLALGECYTFLGDQNDAIRSYRRSAALKSQPLTTIYLAKSYALVGLLEKSEQLLDSVDVATLSAANCYDHAIARTVAAASSRNEEKIKRAKAELRNTTPTDPLFIQERDQWIIRLLETPPESDASSVRKWISRLNRYITLNPNVFGFGLNINKMIEDAENKS